MPFKFEGVQISATIPPKVEVKFSVETTDNSRWEHPVQRTYIVPLVEWKEVNAKIMASADALVRQLKSLEV